MIVPPSYSLGIATKLGFNKVAKYYWASLPPRYQAVLRYAANYAMTEMLAAYDAKNATAIARLVAAGTQLSVLPEEIVKALRVALEQVLEMRRA